MPPLSRGFGLRLPARQLKTYTSLASPRYTQTRSKLFTVAEEVEDALATGKPVVALETTIYTHGYPYPENVALASRLESLVRVHGGVPATIGIVNGKAHVGMDPEKLIELISTAGNKDTWKISRRDLAFIGGLGGIRGQKLHGGTTIAGTMILAHLAGIKIFATGGLGGVHRGGENSMDISADLTELGRTPVAVIASGCKSFLDIPRTLEYLETQGVAVATFADGRQGNVDFPAFYSRDSGVTSPRTIQDELDAAAVVHAQFSLPVQSGLLFANPVPLQAAMAREDIDTVIAQAVDEANQKGITGSANTPYILNRIKELSGGASIVANRALIENNVIRGTKIAVELAKLELQQEDGATHGATTQQGVQVPPSYLAEPASSTTTGQDEKAVEPKEPTDLLVAGSLACDTICDYHPFASNASELTPVLETSNPAKISQSSGGVGRNVALAAHYAGANVAFTSVVADDIAGHSLIDQLKKTGLDTSYVRQLSTAQGARTAQYVAINDKKKDLVIAMADMSILEHPELESEEHWASIISATNPKWVVLDGNWSAKIMSAIISAANTHQIPVAFEPVSTAKAARLFEKDNKSIDSTSVVPYHKINLVTPNALELRAMHEAAQRAGHLETEQWWLTINDFGLSSAGSRDKFTAITNAALVDQGVPQQSIQLLPYIPNIVTKLGPQGVLLTSLLRRDDDRLRDPRSAPYIVSRSDALDSVIGGVYMRLFPPAEHVPDDQIISVNGVGDTLLGVLMAHLVKQQKGTRGLEDVIPKAQEAAVLTLKSAEAVSSAIKKVH